MRRMYVVFGLISILISCKQNPEPENLEQQIPIELKGNLNGKEFLLSLGQEGTFVQAQAYREIDQTLVLQTDLNSTENLSIRMRVNRNQNILPDEVLRTGLFRYYVNPQLSDTSEINRSKVSFRPEPIKPIKQVWWKFEDGTHSTEIQPEKLIYESGEHEVELTVVYTDGCEATTRLPIRIDNTHRTGDLKMAWAFPNNNRNLVLQASFLDSTKLNLVNWEVNGSKVGGLGRALQFECPDSGIYMVCAFIQDKLDTQQTCHYIQTPDTRTCMANFTASGIAEQDQPNFYSIEIKYTNQNGKVYSSSEIIQNSSSFFEIQEIMQFVQTKEGKESKLARLKFSCLLKGQEDILTLRDFSGKIAFRVEE